METFQYLIIITIFPVALTFSLIFTLIFLLIYSMIFPLMIFQLIFLLLMILLITLTTTFISLFPSKNLGFFQLVLILRLSCTLLHFIPLLLFPLLRLVQQDILIVSIICGLNYAESAFFALNPWNSLSCNR